MSTPVVFNEHAFKRKVDEAMKQVRTVLDTTKNPRYPDSVSHTYEDKYTLAETATQSAISSLFTSFEYIGVTDEIYQKMVEWTKENKAVSLQLLAEENCKFIKKVEREVEAGSTLVIEHESHRGVLGTIKDTITGKTMVRITEYKWKFEWEYKINVIVGANSDPQLLQSRKGSTTIITSSENQPRPEHRVHDPVQVNLTWLMQHTADVTPPRKKKKSSTTLSLPGQESEEESHKKPKSPRKKLSRSPRSPRRLFKKESGHKPAEAEGNVRSPSFGINRKLKTCKTPRRNVDVEGALTCFLSIFSWQESVSKYFRDIGHLQTTEKLDMASLNDSGVFVPIVPLLIQDQKKAKNLKSKENENDDMSESEEEEEVDEQSGARQLSKSERIKFVNEEKRSIGYKLEQLAKTFPDNHDLVTVNEANFLCVLAHIASICVLYGQTVDYIEHMLQQQLIAAVGKIIGAKEFGEYMEFHNRKLFGEQYAPKPFVYAVRRPDHCPEGLLAIEADQQDGAVPQPVQSLSRSRAAPAAMCFRLGAATTAYFTGNHHLHAITQHQFSNDKPSKLRLIARARQFSSFVLMIGTIIGAGEFKATHSVIVKDKDELIIPLILEPLPTPKAFRDAIESLSPEMQRFAKAFRAMQLESTLFAVCIVQIKPAMENLLNLTRGGLTKEIKLTQELMELFIDYQIPSDLISFDADADAAGDQNASAQTRLRAVKKHVKDIRKMIDESKQEELKKVEEEARYAVYESIADDGLKMREQESYGGGIESSYVALSSAPVKHKKSKMKKRSMASNSAARSFGAAPGAPPSGGGGGGGVGGAARPPGPPIGGSATTSTKQPEPTKVEKPKEVVQGEAMVMDDVADGVVDYTVVPTKLDETLLALDEDGAVRATTISVGNSN